MAVVSMGYLLEAGVHFGHQTKRWNPKMKEYIFTSRDDIYIIDLQKTAKKIEEKTGFDGEYDDEAKQDLAIKVERAKVQLTNRDKTTIVDYEKEIQNKEALSFIKKNTGEIKINNFVPQCLKILMFKVLRSCPDILRRILTKILKTFFGFLFD